MSDDTGMEGFKTEILGSIQTIQTIEITKDLLIKSIQPGIQLRIDCSAILEVDISFPQLLLSARRFASDLGGDLSLIALSPALNEVLDRGGFLTGATKDPFWDGVTP